ncbi:MAG: UMP kinase, partial [Candidatus Methanomethylophilaceae archaeon]|nr:UMP kinase [Candidatus Methanomethylophilaceae archaeon]
MEKAVVSIGGSILVPGENDSEYISRLASMLGEFSGKMHIAVVCGGGRTARSYARMAKDLGGNTYQQ